MSRFAESLLTRINMLDIRLRCCSVRLQDPADLEALHDLRITLRSLRSLLRPLRGLPAIDVLEQAAAAVGQLSNPLRELQVFVAELQALGMPEPAAELTAQLDPAFRHLLASAELSRLLDVLDAFAPIWRLAAREGCLRGLRRRIRRHFKRQLEKIPGSLHTAPEDLHALRLQVKRLRYGSEAYPQLSQLSPRQLKLLRQLQQALGEWNDCQHWLGCTVADERLARCRPLWLGRAEAALARSGILLEHFERLTPSG